MSLWCILVTVAFVVALLWARHRDSFSRREFSLRTAVAGKTKGMVVLPKPAARFPVVVYFYGSGGNLLSCGQVLRQIAELGCAAVALEYNQTNQLHFNEQLRALDQYVKAQPWAQRNAAAWVGFSLGAQRSLSFLLTHPEIQPQLYVRVAGGLVDELQSPPVHGNAEVGRSSPLRAASPSPADGAHGVARSTAALAPVTRDLSRIACPVLLVHGEGDEVFPVADCRKLAAMLATHGVSVETRTLPGLPHAFGEELGVVLRGVAEYCRHHLPMADYAATLSPCSLSDAERARFNAAMGRAGQNRRELWQAVQSTREPERRTVMMVIGGLEDYDRAHISARHLRELVAVAWRARRAYPWCRETPLDVFEKFSASPRAFEEPLSRCASRFHGRLRREVKYCHTIAQVCDTVGRWERLRATIIPATAVEDPSPMEVLARAGGDCRDLISLYVHLARSVGVALRPVTTTWPTLGSGHYWVEIWDPDRKAWHAFDGSAGDRRYDFDWIFRVAKSVTHAATGERGAWNARKENRWEAFTNTVGLFYPSGTVRVRVLEHETAQTRQRVNVEVWLKSAMVHLTSGVTDAAGQVRFTLGQSAQHRYRVSLAEGDHPDWHWLAVKAGEHYELTLHKDQKRPFDPAAAPPPVDFPQ